MPILAPVRLLLKTQADGKHRCLQNRRKRAREDLTWGSEHDLVSVCLFIQLVMCEM